MNQKINNIVIGIAGRRNSGKDTVASMINYILNTAPEDCTYNEYKNNKNINDSYFNIHITYFADDLKLTICNLFGIEMKEANDRIYKDKLWFCIKERCFYNEENLPNDYHKLDMLYSEKSLAELIDKFNGKCVIRLRNLLQYIGTDIFRRTVYNDIWVDSCINRARRIKDNYGYCLIPDIRFENEVKGINEFNYNTYPSKGKVILVERDVKCKDEHSSEIIDINNDYYIYNNGTLEDLFNEVKFILNKIENEYN